MGSSNHNNQQNNDYSKMKLGQNWTSCVSSEVRTSPKKNVPYIIFIFLAYVIFWFTLHNNYKVRTTNILFK